jgi:ribosomal protein L11 methyltransferase
MENYYCLTLVGCKRKDEEEITDFCFSKGAAGVSEALDFQQDPLIDYNPITIEKDPFVLQAYFIAKPENIDCDEIKKHFGLESAELLSQVNKDWLEEWKKGYEPFILCKNIWVVPRWKTAPETAYKVIWIEPGMAFGTGTHETTQMVSELLSNLKIDENSNLLDVGTGSGILAILASHLGCKYNLGIDNDPEALRVARENIELNSVESSVKIVDNDLHSIHEPFEIVLANIIDGVLTSLKSELCNKIKPGGRIIISGVLKDRWPIFKEEFMKGTHLKLEEHLFKGEWVGAVFRA